MIKNYVVISLILMAGCGEVNNPEDSLVGRLPQGYFIEEIDAVDDDLVYVLGSRIGNIKDVKVLKSTDGGVSWSTILDGHDHFALCMEFVDSQNGWVGCDSLTADRTTNGGKSWEHINVGGFGAFVGDFCFVDADTGYALTWGWNGLAGAGAILKSTNRGMKWTMMTFSLKYALVSIDVLGQNIWAVSGGIVDPMDSPFRIWSDDGGATWDVLEPDVTCCTLRKVDMADRLDGYSINLDLLRTRNGGIGWMMVADFAQPIVDMVVHGREDLHIITSYAAVDTSRAQFTSVIMRTVDGGTSWSTEWSAPNGTDMVVTSLSFVNENVGWAAGGYSDSSAQWIPFILKYNGSDWLTPSCK